MFEFAWNELLLMIGPFVIGLLIGALVKRSVKLGLLVVALVVALVALGYVSFSFFGFYNEYLAPIVRWIINSASILPYTSVAFLIGLAVGIWKG